MSEKEDEELQQALGRICAKVLWQLGAWRGGEAKRRQVSLKWRIGTLFKKETRGQTTQVYEPP